MTASGKGPHRERKIALQQVTIWGLGQAVGLWIYLEFTHNRLGGTEPLCYERQGRAVRGYIPPGAEYSKAAEQQTFPFISQQKNRDQKIEDACLVSKLLIQSENHHDALSAWPRAIS